MYVWGDANVFKYWGATHLTLFICKCLSLDHLYSSIFCTMSLSLSSVSFTPSSLLFSGIYVSLHLVSFSLSSVSISESSLSLCIHHLVSPYLFLLSSVELDHKIPSHTGLYSYTKYIKCHSGKHWYCALKAVLCDDDKCRLIVSVRPGSASHCVCLSAYWIT